VALYCHETQRTYGCHDNGESFLHGWESLKLRTANSCRKAGLDIAACPAAAHM
jgi:hypothetical protein